MKPVLFVTGHVAADRAGAFELLHERVPIELALYGGPHQHGAPPAAPPGGDPAPLRSPSARSARWSRAAPTGPSSSAPAGASRSRPPGARRARAGVPFVFWAALWRTPRTAAHLAALPLMRRIYRDADAIVTYGDARQRLRARARRDARVRRAAGRRQRVLVGRRGARAPTRASRRCSSGVRRARRASRSRSRRGGKRASTGRSPWSANTRPLPGDVVAAGRVDPARTAQLLRGERRSGCTVDRDAALHRAVGAGRQRSHEPGNRDHRHRRRRRRRRRPRPRRAQRPRSCRPATRARSPHALRALAGDRDALRGARRRRTRGRPPTPTTPGRTRSCRR